MIIEYYRATDRKTLEPAPGRDPLEAWLKEKHPLWVFVAEASPDEITALLQPLDLPSVIVNECVKGEAGARVLPLAKQVFFEFPVTDVDGASYVSALALPMLAIVMFRGPADTFHNLSRIVHEIIELPSSNPAALLGMVLAGLSLLDMERALAKRADVNRMAADQEDDVNSVRVEEILRLKRELRGLESVAEEKRLCFDTLNRIRSDSFHSGEAGSYLQIAVANAEYMERLVDRLNVRAEDLYNRNIASLQERTNKRLATLTVLSAVFLPLTLIAGIEGMNFESMPELKWAYGYFMTLGLMALIAIALVFLFWRKGWFD